MLYIEVREVGKDQIMLIQNEWTSIYQVVIESIQNYSFTPDYVSKGFKTKKSAKSLFDKLVIKYERKLKV